MTTYATTFIWWVTMSQLLRNAGTMEWIECVRPGDSKRVELECEQGMEIQVTQTSTGRQQQMSWSGFCNHPFTNDNHCVIPNNEETEGLRSSCNTKRWCEKYVFSPMDICPDYSGNPYVIVEYECHSVPDPSQVFNPMASTETYTGEELVLQSDQYPLMTNTITNCTCNIDAKNGMDAYVYDLTHDSSFDFSPYSIFLTVGQHVIAQISAVIGGPSSQSTRISGQAVLHFAVKTSNPVQGRFWIVLSARNHDLAVTCSTVPTTGSRPGSTSSPPGQSPSPGGPTSPKNPSATSTSAPSTTSQEMEEMMPMSSGVSEGAIAGGVVGALLLIIIAAVILVLFLRKKRREKSSQIALNYLDHSHASLPNQRPSNDYEVTNGDARPRQDDDPVTGEQLNPRPLPPTPLSTPPQTRRPLPPTPPLTPALNQHPLPQTPPLNERPLPSAPPETDALHELYTQPHRRLSGEMDLVENEMYR